MEELGEISKKGKLKNWLKNPYTLALIAVILFAFIIRLYYFILVGNQPLWWDEASYGSIARNFVSHIWDGTNVIKGESLIRPMLFPIIWSLLLRISLPEIGTRLLLEFIPSILSVLLIYLISKELFNRRIGLLAAFIFSVIWIHLFYSLRLLVHIPSLALVFFSIYLFFKATKSDFNFKYFSASLFALCLATLMRYPKGLTFFVYFIFLIMSKNFKITKIKFWIYGLIGMSPLIIFFIINLLTSGNIFPTLFSANYITVPGQAVPFAFGLLNYIPIYLQTTFFIFFVLGLGMALFEMVLGYNLINKEEKLRHYLFLILIIIIFYSYFIFYLRSAEDRYFFVTTLPLSCFAALGLDMLYKLIKKYSKPLGIAVITAILIFGAYSQLAFADSIIKDKKEGFLQIKQGLEWIRDNTPQNSVIIGPGTDAYIIYYSERKYLNLPENNLNLSLMDQADYLFEHAFTSLAPQPDYLNNYLAEHSDQWKPLNAVFFDADKKQPAFIIFKNENR
jgi:4-amino-4-deoxy-L-arabinose transferase-like glycosyltransferase